ncbi:hypothetical protein [Labilibacter marinus]|uniref:hypothetical protein n=1 Tax=Labilibacter marinus TaxID=1477105 RepID=UPI00082B989A|nr:hypothetical protein [Labilibacter marinus]
MNETIKKRIKQRSDSELLLMIEKHNDYQKGFVLAAHYELKARNIDFDETETLKIIETSKVKKQAVEDEIKRQKIVIKTLPSKVKIARVLIYVSVALRIIKMLLVESYFGNGAIEIPYLPDIFSIASLIFIDQVFIKGHFKIRLIFLVGFILNTYIAIRFMLGLELPLMSTLIYILHILMKLFALILLFSKPVNQWIDELTKPKDV